ncbi:Uncharacterized oxidoreductase yvaA [Brevibacterium casei]|uniref:Uncharacterized oxidoreductase yvaA n=1 Tax=Brevibacterium casei TaxID=33889 RepID=A0A449DB14_9MICO|nr:Gfo/Idh/MocA family oxidoreductase [Brevibacterium casei]VEW14724.1 Uncharacterized oxidoreductase yvaA [Brevibacterium casei]
MSNLRAGLIGLGMMGRHHARNLNALEGVELVAVADAFGDVHNVAGDVPIFSDIDDLIEFGIDYCVVAVPTHLHYEIGKKLAAAGVHALIEKPLAGTYAEALELAELFETAGLVGAVGHIERFNSSLQELRRRLNAGDLGNIYQISTSRQGPFPSRIADVGVIKDLASHDIDLTTWVAGCGYKTVASQSLHKSGREHEDMVAATGLLLNDVTVNHLVNWLTPTKERRTTVVGAGGMFVADTLTSDLTFFANASVDSEWQEISHFRGVAEGNVTRFAFPKPEPLRVEHEYLRDAIEGDSSREIVTLRQGAEVLRVCEAMLDSSKTGNTITL